MRLAAHQPNFAPNLAFFSKMKEVDLFIVITNLQFEKNEGWQRRHKILTKNGDMWLTVPVLGSQNQLIKDVIIDNKIEWGSKFVKTLKLIYGKSKGSEYIPEFERIFLKKWERLADLNITLLLLIHDILGIQTKVVLDEQVSGVKHTLIGNICKKYNASIYVSGFGAKSYMNVERLQWLEDQGISHQYVAKNLTSAYPYSSLHYLLLEGKEWILNVL